MSSFPTLPPQSSPSSSQQKSKDEEFRSPNAIPPRTSSTGQNRLSLGQAAAKPVLKPLAEASWISSSSLPLQQMSGSTATITPNNGGDGDGSNSTMQSIPADAFKGDGSTWTGEKEKIVLGPYDYLFGRPGKDIRRSMISAFNIWLKVPEERLAIINKVVGMLHTASLLIDDIEDSSHLRRGIPVAHHIFGSAQTLNSANYVYFLALQELQKLGNPRFTEIYAEELVNLHRGQGMDLYWRDTLTCPTESDYIEMVGNKTGGLFRLAVKLMMAESSTDKDFTPLVTLLGIIFQIRDDYLNLSHAHYTSNKGLCEDLTEGKFSFPIIHAIRADPQDRQLINILKQKPREDAVKRYAVEYMEKVGSFGYTRKVVGELVGRALGMIDGLEEDGEERKGLLGAAVREIVGRMVLE